MATVASKKAQEAEDFAISQSLLDIDEPDALRPDLRYAFRDMLVTVISIATYLFDLVMDCIVALHFFHLASQEVYHYWYFGLTVTFVILPSLTMTGFSLRWYLMDSDNAQLPPVPTWKWILRVAVLLFQIAPILRYIDSMRYGLLSRKFGQKEAESAENPTEKKKAREQRIKYFTLMVYEDADATLLRLFECFMESAPQLILQIYILIKDPDVVNSTHLETDLETNLPIKKWILVISIVSSLCSVAWSLVVYHRSLRYTFPEKKNLHWKGGLFQFLWHFSSITARVIALSLFAAIFPQGIGPACVVHWLIMSTWVVFQNTTACSTKCEELLFCLVLGAIYIFSFFNAKEEKTRYKYLFYYTFCFCENSALMVLWFFYGKPLATSEGVLAWYFYPAIFGHYLAFFAGIFFMVIYYVFFHPSGVDVPFCKKRRRRPTSNGSAVGSSTGQNDQAEGQTQNERPITLAFQEPETSELGPISRLSVSTPVLDEGDHSPSPPKSPVRRTLSEPPEGQADHVVIDFKARRSIKNQKSIVEQ